MTRCRLTKTGDESSVVSARCAGRCEVMSSRGYANVPLYARRSSIVDICFFVVVKPFTRAVYVVAIPSAPDSYIARVKHRVCIIYFSRRPLDTHQ